jgi:hypothetical protein
VIHLKKARTKEQAMDQEKNKPVYSLSRLTFPGLALSLVSVVVAMMSGLGSRWGLWHFSTGFKILGGAALGGGIASLISLISLALKIGTHPILG